MCRRLMKNVSLLLKNTKANCTVCLADQSKNHDVAASFSCCCSCNTCKTRESGKSGKKELQRDCHKGNGNKCCSNSNNKSCLCILALPLYRSPSLTLPVLLPLPLLLPLSLCSLYHFLLYFSLTLYPSLCSLCTYASVMQLRALSVACFRKPHAPSCRLGEVAPLRCASLRWANM